MEITIFSTETIKAITIYTFLLLVFIIMFRYLIFSKDIENKGVAKIIGGLTVFIVALISENPMVIGVSLFIGGLIIASEEFMQKLAIIFRSRSEDIGKNLEPISATPQEIKAKHQQEIQETVEILEEKQTIKNELTEKDLLKFKEQVRQYWRKLFGDNFEEDIKLIDHSTNQSLIVDGILSSKSKNSIEYIFEILVIPSLTELETMITNRYSKIHATFPVQTIFNIISLGDINTNTLKKIEKLNTKDISIILFEVKNKQVFLKV